MDTGRRVGREAFSVTERPERSRRTDLNGSRGGSDPRVHLNRNVGRELQITPTSLGCQAHVSEMLSPFLIETSLRVSRSQPAQSENHHHAQKKMVKLNKEIIEAAPSYINAVKDRELSFRGGFLE